MARILLIDDNADILKLFTRILEQDGHEVVTASDGHAGLKLYFTNQFDLVITDIVMPEKEGIEVIREIKKESPLTKVVAISGGGTALASEICLKLADRLGADKTLPKPVSRAELLNVVRELCG